MLLFYFSFLFFPFLCFCLLVDSYVFTKGQYLFFWASWYMAKNHPARSLSNGFRLSHCFPLCGTINTSLSFCYHYYFPLSEVIQFISVAYLTFETSSFWASNLIGFPHYILFFPYCFRSLCSQLSGPAILHSVIALFILSLFRVHSDETTYFSIKYT